MANVAHGLVGAMAALNSFGIGRGLNSALHRTAGTIYPSMDEWFDAVEKVGGCRAEGVVHAMRSTKFPVPDRAEWPHWVNWVMYANQHGLQIGKNLIAAAERGKFIQACVWPMPIGRTWYLDDELRNPDLAMVCDAAATVELLIKSNDDG